MRRTSYEQMNCSIASALDVVGEPWTLLIVRDAFYGVRRFSDFQAHLGIPKAVLSERLAFLVAEDVLARSSGAGGRDEYVLTDKGRRLWPTLWSLITWGNENYLQTAMRRTYRHIGCDGTVEPDGVCAACGQPPDVADIVVHPPRRRGAGAGRDDQASRALRRPHRLLEPVRNSG